MLSLFNLSAKQNCDYLFAEMPMAFFQLSVFFFPQMQVGVTSVPDRRIMLVQQCCLLGEQEVSNQHSLCDFGTTKLFCPNTHFHSGVEEQGQGLPAWDAVTISTHEVG